MPHGHVEVINGLLMARAVVYGGHQANDAPMR